MTLPTSQQLESFVPVYDTVPENWEEARQFLVEHLKKISNAVNIREIGFFLDEELLSGKAFIPGVTIPGNNPGQFRQILRKVVETGALVLGVNPGVPHGIVFDGNFKLIQIWVSGTRTSTLAQTIGGNAVTMDTVNINITSPSVFDYSVAVIEYIQEL